MFRKVDLLAVFGAAMMFTGLVCFKSTNPLAPAWVLYLGGLLLWFLGTAVAIVWMVCRCYPKAAGSPESVTSTACNKKTDNPNKEIRAALLVFAGILATFLLAVPAEAADAPTGGDIFKSKYAMCQGPDGRGKTAMGQKLSIPDPHSADPQNKSQAEIESLVAKGNNKMPGYEGKLTPAQISQVSVFIKSLAAQH